VATGLGVLKKGVPAPRVNSAGDSAAAAGAVCLLAGALTLDLRAKLISEAL